MSRTRSCHGPLALGGGSFASSSLRSASNRSPLLRKYVYSAIGPTPSSLATARVLHASAPEVSITRSAVCTISSGLRVLRGVRRGDRTSMAYSVQYDVRQRERIIRASRPDHRVRWPLGADRHRDRGAGRP